jgi:hypothetical protein
MGKRISQCFMAQTHGNFIDCDKKITWDNAVAYTFQIAYDFLGGNDYARKI